MWVQIGFGISVVSFILTYLVMKIKYENNTIMFTFIALGISLNLSLVSLLFVFSLENYAENLWKYWFWAIFSLILFSIIIYPLWEMIHFSQEGKQAHERYHRLMENILDNIYKIIPNKYVVGCFGFAVFYILPGYTISRLLTISITWSYLLGILIVPSIILGYYGAIGSLRSLQFEDNNRAKQGLFRSLAMVSIILASYRVYSNLFGFSIVGLLNDTFLFINIPERPATLLSILTPIVVGIGLSLYGFYSDFWHAKHTKTYFHFIFAMYLLFIISFNGVFKLLIHSEFARLYVDHISSFLIINEETIRALSNYILIEQFLILIIIPIAYFSKSFQIQIQSQELEHEDPKISFNAFKTLIKYKKDGAIEILRNTQIENLVYMTTYGQTIFSVEVNPNKSKNSDISLTAGLISAIYSMTLETQKTGISQIIMEDNYIDFFENTNERLVIIQSKQSFSFYSQFAYELMKTTVHIPDGRKLKINDLDSAINFISHVDYEYNDGNFEINTPPLTQIDSLPSLRKKPNAILNDFIMMTKFGQIFYSYSRSELSEEPDISLFAGLLSALYSMSEEIYGKKVSAMKFENDQYQIFREGKNEIVFIISIYPYSADYENRLDNLIEEFEELYDLADIEGRILEKEGRELLDKHLLG